MTDEELLSYHVLARRKFNLLTEVLEISKEMGQAMDRSDQTSLRKLLVARNEPIEKLDQLEKDLENTRLSFSGEDRAHLKAIMKGEAQNNPKEIALCRQMQDTLALLKEVIELDARINTRVSGKDSVYQQQ